MSHTQLLLPPDLRSEAFFEDIVQQSAVPQPPLRPLSRLFVSVTVALALLGAFVVPLASAA